MTKIKNTVAYVVKSPLSLDDYAVGTNDEEGVDGFVKGQTISMKLSEMRGLFLEGLAPETGGTLKITEIEVDTLDTDIATTVNALSPTYDVFRYEVVFFNIEGRIYVLKLVDITIGDGGETLTNDNFIIFPVSSGPAGADGADGADGDDGTEIELQKSSTHIQWRYVGAPSWTNLVALADLVGPTGATGATGATGPAGTTVVANGITTTKTGSGTSGDPYKIETNNNQRVITSSILLANTDDQTTVFVDNGSSPVSITVPPNLKDNFIAGFWQEGSGDVTFVDDTGTTIITAIGKKIKGQGYFVMLEKKGSTATYYLGNATKA